MSAFTHRILFDVRLACEDDQEAETRAEEMYDDLAEAVKRHDATLLPVATISPQPEYPEPRA